MKLAVRRAVALRAKQARLQKLLKKHGRKLSSRSFHAATPAVGTTRTWLALDDSAGFYRKQFTLRGVGAHSEVWVATPVTRPFNGFTSIGTDFQAGDCRNGPRTVIGDDAGQLPDRTSSTTTSCPRSRRVQRRARPGRHEQRRSLRSLGHVPSRLLRAAATRPSCSWTTSATRTSAT